MSLEWVKRRVLVSGGFVFLAVSPALAATKLGRPHRDFRFVLRTPTLWVGSQFVLRTPTLRAGSRFENADCRFKSSEPPGKE